MSTQVSNKVSYQDPFGSHEPFSGERLTLLLLGWWLPSTRTPDNLGIMAAVIGPVTTRKDGSVFRRGCKVYMGPCHPGSWDEYIVLDFVPTEHSNYGRRISAPRENYDATRNDNDFTSERLIMVGPERDWLPESLCFQGNGLTRDSSDRSVSTQDSAWQSPGLEERRYSQKLAYSVHGPFQGMGTKLTLSGEEPDQAFDLLMLDNGAAIRVSKR